MHKGRLRFIKRALGPPPVLTYGESYWTVAWIVSRGGEGEGSRTGVTGVRLICQWKLGRGSGIRVSLDSASGYRTTERLISQTPNTEGGRVGFFYFSQEQSVTAVQGRIVWPRMSRHILLRAMTTSPLESARGSPSRACNPARSEPKTPLKSAEALPFFRNGFFPVMKLSLDLRYSDTAYNITKDKINQNLSR